MKTYKIAFLAIFLSISFLSAQEDLITNIDSRKKVSLNGTWNYIIDPYNTGFLDYHLKERQEDDREAYWQDPTIKDKTERIEHGYQMPYTIQVPGDWNSQDEKFLYYEGTVWYQRNFDLDVAQDERVYLYFGAVNYETHVYLNGKKLGTHNGGFTAFNFEIPKDVLKEKDNFLVVMVNNTRKKNEIPSLNLDWWNFGGITRNVSLVIVPEKFIQSYSINLDQDQDIQSSKKRNRFKIEGTVHLNKPVPFSIVTVEIPALKLHEEYKVEGDSCRFNFEVKDLKLWAPGSPKLYQVAIRMGEEELKENIGFRKIETSGKDVLLNGEPIFLRGVCIHEEIPQDMRRAYSREDALTLLGWAVDLNANMVRLAHYPHNENMVKIADSLGLMVWSEIPVYWALNFESDEVLKNAKTQLEEMISRDKNRASVVIWSVGNETPVSATRTEFMKELIFKSKELDDTRLVSAALQVHNIDGTFIIDDPLGEFTDIVSVNEYLGWYGGLPDDAQTAKWEVTYDKPLFFSETGAGAKGGFHADKTTRWSEEYQAWFFEEQIKMMKRMPDNYCGIAPWILTDFRSPRRNNPEYQEGWNRKGLIDDKGNKKEAFYVLEDYYDEIEARQD
ncbi:beta galactosidase jelly roll domain-containing protein [Flavobacteriaceae bacterium F89]|uniref:Beta galactosidase jelly roll domain-containing protein n=1 Tax=Cerina litoralis TaxID=2874477 RepID=A0AAE3EWK9_9FLAO|nr:glycoside hydrolase family 2 TIM barrel-domain containing protein [Cerina litoralis]MCG2461613.1 beta galactosidase jelly roll domain-containing protein [Cerina litoralis]